MQDLEFHWIGWCQEGTSDKIWGYCSAGGTSQCYIFWGRRGRSLSFKKSTKWDADSLGYKKQDRGYQSITEAQLREVWTTFENTMSSQLCFAILADKVK